MLKEKEREESMVKEIKMRVKSGGRGTDAAENRNG